MKRLTRRHLLLGAAGAAAMLPRLGAAAASPLEQDLRALLDDAQFPLASLSVQVHHAGRAVFAAQLGRRYIAPAGGQDLPVTPDTLFRVASISKLLTGLGALRLADAGKLDLDADIGTLLGFPLRNPHFPDRAITARMLMSHCSSLRDRGGVVVEAGSTVQSFLSRPGSRSWGTEGAPGGYFQYCNLNYGLLASVMERASGQRFDRLMQAEVLGPLGMQGGFDATQLPPAQLAQVATLYRKRSDESQGEVWNAAGPWVAQTDDFHAEAPMPVPGLAGYAPGSNGSLFGPQGRLRTRVQDLGRVLAMLAAGGVHEGGRFLQASSVEAMFSERWRFDPAAAPANGDNLAGEFQAWGSGAQHFIDRSRAQWGDRLLPEGGVQAWGHLGFAYGLQSGLMLDPGTGHGIVYVIGGHAADPDTHRGRYSSFAVWEERLHELLWRAALRGA